MVMLLYCIMLYLKMIESKAFDEMNVTCPIEPDAEPHGPTLGPGSSSQNNIDNAASAPSGLLQRIKYKFKRQVTIFVY